MKNLVSVIVVSYNSIDLVKPCLEGLLSLSYQPIEIIFVVNGSSDGTAGYIKKKYPRIKLLENKTNIGFGPAVNLGIGKASGEYIWIYNDDAICQKNSLTPLVNALQSDQLLAACQGTIVRLPEKTIESQGSFFSITGVLYRPARDAQRKDSIEIFSANLPLVKSSVLKEVGLFDSDYFLYFEEADLCWRIWQAGYTIKHIPESLIYHKPCSTTSKLPHEVVIYESFKNRINSTLKNLQTPRLFVVLTLHLLLVSLAFLYLLLRLKLKNANAILKSIFWNIKVIRKTLVKREILSKRRKAQDKEIFAQVQRPLDLSYYFTNARDYFSQW